MSKKIIFSVAVFIAGLCSIVYELLISTAATFFLGNGVKQFSIIIGVYLFSMGIGAFLSKFHKGASLLYFIHIEYLLGLIGGVSVPIIYWLFVTIPASGLQIACLGIIFLIGLLTGMEVPLLTFSRDDSIRESLSDILSLDYIGGLIATLLFPFILLPFIGLFYSSLMFGAINIVLGLWLNRKFYPENKKSMALGGLALLVLVILTVQAASMLQVWDEKIYKHPIIYNKQTSYQRIVLTKKQEDVRLFLNRVIQFSSLDENRYHESLIHTPLTMLPGADRVLILGGGENLASREVLKHPGITHIDVVDIDNTIFELAKTHPDLLEINQGAATDPRVNLIMDDAFTYLARHEGEYDLIVADLPDPSEISLAKLYSRQFFYLVQRNLSENGVFVTQAGEIYFANSVFSCINNTMADCFGEVRPYHVYVPSFGDWGFVMASENEIPVSQSDLLVDNLSFLDVREMENSFFLPKDITIAETKINGIDNPVILDYYLDDWNRWKTDLTNNPASTR